MSPDPSRRLAADLLSIGAVAFSPDRPFTWASGLLSPVYCDNRLTLGHPAIRRRITDGFAAAVSDLHFDVVAGTATAGIPHAAWLADRLGLPMVYVRSAAKGHGRGRRVEGPLDPGARVVVVEDLVSTGMSSLSAVEGLRDEGAEVVALVAIFSYGLPAARDAVARAGVDVRVLTTFDVLLEEAVGSGRISGEGAASLRAWYEDPNGWSRERGGAG